MRLNFWNEDFLCRYRRQIRQNGYLYLRNIPPNFQWISFSQSLTRSCLIPQACTVYIRDFKKVGLILLIKLLFVGIRMVVIIQFHLAI